MYWMCLFQGKVALCVLILKTVFQIEAELTKERARHLIEFQEQALLFKEEAKLELDIEKEKHQEVIQKYQQEQEDLQKKVCHHCLCSSPGIINLVFPSGIPSFL